MEKHLISWNLKPDGSVIRKLETLPAYPILLAEVMLQQSIAFEKLDEGYLNCLLFS